MAKAKRKYDIFLNFGFAIVKREDEQLPRCVICFKSLFNVPIEAYQLKQLFFKNPLTIHWQNKEFLIDLKSHPVFIECKQQKFYY